VKDLRTLAAPPLWMKRELPVFEGFFDGFSLETGLLLARYLQLSCMNHRR
jgi:hypothetical protein